MECTHGIISSCPNTLQGTTSQLFLTLINTLMMSQCTLGPEGRYPPDHGAYLKDGDEFDFIVVGSGSAGSVVASRLSEIEDWKVLLLEAGTYPSALTEVPFLMLSIRDTDEDWQYQMEPSDTCCLGLKNQRCPCPRGKAIGGTSIINAMMYIRGNPKDYNNWEKAGNPGWDWDSVLKSYNKFENAQGDDDGEVEGNFGKHGELNISRYTSDHPIHHIMKDAYKEMGYGYYKEDKPLGFFETYVTISTGTRTNTAKAFLGKAKDRKSLHVAVNAQVAKLLISPESKTVDGVEVRIKDKMLKVKSRKEVILSAGSINSPQILMNSGIGPKEHLESLGIKVIKNLKVGENLQDHAIYPAFFVNIDKHSVKSKSATDEIDDLYNYFMHRKGPYGEVGITNMAAFVNPNHDSEFPSIQIIPMLHKQNDNFLPQLQRGWNLPENVITQQLEHNKNSNNVLLLPVLLNPKSAGKVLLRSADPFDSPKIFPNFFSDSNNEDLEVVVQGIRTLESLIKTKSFSRHEAQLVDFEITNCSGITKGTDDYWKCAVRNLGTHIFHPVGTCKMGLEEDPSTVVDSRLKVHGIKSVRVIDGSIMPHITSCNTNAPIMMIGEKGAQFIKEDWSKEHDEL